MIKQFLIILLIFLSCEQKKHTEIQREIIQTDKAPKAIGPYSQAIKMANRVYLAGQIGLDPNGSGLKEGIENQTTQTLTNISEILKEAGFTLNHVVQCQIFLTDMNDYKTVNAIYSDFFKDSKPARAVVEVSKIPANALIEIMLIAEK